MDWKKQAIELPPWMHEAVAVRAYALGGNRRGLTRYVWTVAALITLELDDEVLRAAAGRLRDEFERNAGDISQLASPEERVPFVDLASSAGKEQIEKSVRKLLDRAGRTRQKPGAKRSGTE